MSEVEFYIADFEGDQKAVLEYFHRVLAHECELAEKMRYKIPFYFGRSWICYLNPLKDGSVDLAFIRGCALSNSHGILEEKGRKQVTSVNYKSIKEIPAEAIRETIQEAILLDETVKYESKRTKK